MSLLLLVPLLFMGLLVPGPGGERHLGRSNLLPTELLLVVLLLPVLLRVRGVPSRGSRFQAGRRGGTAAAVLASRGRRQRRARRRWLRPFALLAPHAQAHSERHTRFHGHYSTSVIPGTKMRLT